jgi:hypothetical protein
MCSTMFLACWRRAREAIGLYRARRADRTVAEVNNGAEMMASEQLTYFGVVVNLHLATREKCPTLAVGHPILFFDRVPGTFGCRLYYILAGSQVWKCPVIGRVNEGGLPPSA